MVRIMIIVSDSDNNNNNNKPLQSKTAFGRSLPECRLASPKIGKGMGMPASCRPGPG